jgi:hypothetical protein
MVEKAAEDNFLYKLANTIRQMPLSIYQKCKKFWRGGYSLPRSFWGFYVLGLFSYLFLCFLIALPLSSLGLKPLGRALLASYFLYPLWASVGVWRSARPENCSRGWGIIAKGVVAFYGIAILFQLLINGGAVRMIDYIGSR